MLQWDVFAVGSWIWRLFQDMKAAEDAWAAGQHAAGLLGKVLGALATGCGFVDPPPCNESVLTPLQPE